MTDLISYIDFQLALSDSLSARRAQRPHLSKPIASVPNENTVPVWIGLQHFVKERHIDR